VPDCSFVSRGLSRWILGIALLWLSSADVQAQSPRSYAPFFGAVGGGLSDYTGDFPAQNVGHPLDLQELIRGHGPPLAATAEIGYRPTPAWAVVLGVQAGNYPIAGYGGREGLKDSDRYTLSLLGRYAIGRDRWPVHPYIDAGVNVTFAGLRTGYGPSVGGGVELPIGNRLSVFAESRVHFTAPDVAVDGSRSTPNGSSTGPVDALSQLLGLGLRLRFGGEDRGTTASAPDATRPPPAPRSSVPTMPDTERQASEVQIPSGTFIMGLTDEDPLALQSAGRARVTVSAFFLDAYEVSNADYRGYLGTLSADARAERLPDSSAFAAARTQDTWRAYFRSEHYADYPVVAVTWADARAYCQAQGKRLPTEAEWEHAARAGHIGRVYPWGGLRTQGPTGRYRANFKPTEGYAIDGYAFTAPVDTLRQNRWGLYHMAGNVAEWTRDAYTPLYSTLSDFNPHHEAPDAPRRVVRGGAWNSRAAFIGVGMRDARLKSQASVDVGFRCARDLAGTAPERSVSEEASVSRSAP